MKTVSSRTTLLATTAVAVLAVGALSGCIQSVDEYYDFDPDAQYKNPGVFVGDYMFGNGGSVVLTGGKLLPGRPEVTRLVSNLPAYPDPAGLKPTDGTVYISLAVWKPLNATGRIPVIVDAGPYFEIGQHCPTGSGNLPPERCPVPLVDDTIDYPGQTTPFSLKNFLPRGYAVAQVAVRGTGTSGGCMDLMGPSEVHDLDQAITWLGEQPWSNGNVAMIGASYDGSTPWEVASTGNPYLKTIIPVAGLPDMYGLMFHNGTSETRGPIMHNQVYWPFGFSDEFPYDALPGLPETPPSPVPLPPIPRPSIFGGQANGRETYQNLQNLVCPEVVEGSAVAQASVVSGSRAGQASTYWTERDYRQRILYNYNGSVFLIHGMQDWNVDPHSAIPFNEALRAKGIEMKEWYGQWDHAFPDSNCGARSPEWYSIPCRLDFAEVLVRWLDHSLQGETGVDLGPPIQVQDDIGFWRNADSFPPRQPAWTEFHLTGTGTLAAAGGAETVVTLMPPQGSSPATIVELKSAPLADDLRFSGLPQVHLPFAAKASGGEIAAWLFDEDAEGKVRAPFAVFGDDRKWSPVGIPIVGHSQMNLLYADGGEEPKPLTPGERRTARMEFEPLDVLIPRGHRITLWLFQYAYPDHLQTSTPGPVDIYLGGDGAVLRLPVVPDDPTIVFPVPGVHFPDRLQTERMHVDKPVYSGGLTASFDAAPVCSDLPVATVASAAGACGG